MTLPILDLQGSESPFGKGTNQRRRTKTSVLSKLLTTFCTKNPHLRIYCFAESR